MPLTLAITADLHWGHRKGAEATRLLSAYLHEHPPDVLLLAGDIGTGNAFGDCLALFADLPGVKALVYLNAFAPAAGEAANDLAYKFPGSMLTPENLTVRPYPANDPTETGQEAYINADAFQQAFAADVDRDTTAAMASFPHHTASHILQSDGLT